MTNTCILMGREAIWKFCILHKRASMVTLRKGKKKNIYIYTYVYQKCVDFYVVQCSVRRSRAQYNDIYYTGLNVQGNKRSPPTVGDQ